MRISSSGSVRPRPRKPPDPSVDLLGWDLAFGVPIDQVNAYLATNASKFAASFSEMNGMFAGSIGTWRVLRGGTGRLLKMAISIIGGESNSTWGHIDLTGVELEFQIDLAFQPAPESGNKSHLTFNLTGSGDSSHITPIRVTQKGALADKVTTSLVSRYLPQCLQAHAANLRYILACAALGRDPGSWLDAKHWDYVYFQPDGSTQAFLTVLGSASTTAFPSEAKVDPALFSQSTGNQNEVFLAVGKDQFMNHVIIPGLALAYPLAMPGTFVFDAATQTIKSTSGFSVGGKATLATLSLSIDNATATINTTGTASVGFNSTINWQTTSKNAITFDSVTQVLHFASDPTVIALVRLFEPRQVGLELFFVGPGGAVDALQLLVPGIAAPIGAGHLRQLERLGQLAGRVKVHQRVLRPKNRSDRPVQPPAISKRQRQPRPVGKDAAEERPRHGITEREGARVDEVHVCIETVDAKYSSVFNEHAVVIDEHATARRFCKLAWTTAPSTNRSQIHAE